MGEKDKNSELPTSEIPLPNKVEVMASCDHLGDKPQRPFVLSYSRTGKQDNRNCFTQAVFPTASCCNNENNDIYKCYYSNSSPTKQSYGRRLLGDEVKTKFIGGEIHPTNKLAGFLSHGI